MKVSRILLTAVPAGVALGAVAFGLWTMRKDRSGLATGGSDSDAVPSSHDGKAALAPVGIAIQDAGLSDQVASVVEAMADEGGAVLITEVTPVGGHGDQIVTETLVVPEASDERAGGHHA